MAKKITRTEFAEKMSRLERKLTQVCTIQSMLAGMRGHMTMHTKDTPCAALSDAKLGADDPIRLCVYVLEQARMELVSEISTLKAEMG